MGKGYNTKIKRGQKIYASKYHRYSPGGIILTVVIVGALFAAGWFLYPPIYNILTGEHKVETPKDQTPEPSEAEQGSLEEETQKDSQEPETQPQQPASLGSIKAEYIGTAKIATKAQLQSTLSAIDKNTINSVVLDLKDENGLILYNTSNEKAKVGEVVALSPFNLNEYVDSIKEKGFTPIARISAFKDPLAKQVDYNMVVKYNNTDISWLDKAPEYGGKSWINPYSSQGHEYIKGIIKEACEAGFEKIILTNVQFPNGYSMETATYPQSSGKTKPQALKDFVTDAKKVAKENGAELYVYIEAPKALGMDTVIYGTNPLEVMGEDIILGVMPSLLGNKLQNEAVSIQNPITTPYQTVKSVLEAMQLADKNVVAMVQGYTSQEYKGSSNYMEYTQKEIDEQIKAAADAGVDNYIIYK